MLQPHVHRLRSSYRGSKAFSSSPTAQASPWLWRVPGRHVGACSAGAGLPRIAICTPRSAGSLASAAATATAAAANVVAAALLHLHSLQLDHIGSTSHEECTAQHLETLLVLDLQRPASAAAALTFDAASASGSATDGALALPLGEPVQHVAIGGGPHLLLAAATRDTLVVVSLEGLAAHLFQRQASSGSAAGPSQPLWQQLAAVSCGHAELLAIRWDADWRVSTPLDRRMPVCGSGCATV